MIDFNPETELDEVIQNIRTILATPVESVPLDRGLGVLGGALDMPLPAARARLTRDIVEAVAEYEPRAEVTGVSFDGDALTGELVPMVTFKLKSGGGEAVV